MNAGFRGQGGRGMPVFISHRKADSRTALEVKDLLELSQIQCYIDELDEELKKSHDITGVIMKRIVQCTHLLAVVSKNTEGSWWVPFEIGVASKADRRISTYKTVRDVKLPEYLHIWPIMHSLSQLPHFISLYRGDKQVLIEKKALQYEIRKATIHTAEQFHYGLKKAIGQI